MISDIRRRQPTQIALGLQGAQHVEFADEADELVLVVDHRRSRHMRREQLHRNTECVLPFAKHQIIRGMNLPDSLQSPGRHAGHRLYGHGPSSVS
jgi:hypothetical protein